MQESLVCKRLDRFLYSNVWELSFPQSLQEVLPRWTSDHWLIVLNTNPFKWGPTPFRFENMWLQHPSFKECFSSWWREFEGNDWEANIDVIEQEGVLSSDLSVQRVVRKGALEEIILRKEIHWRQKAKVKWVKDGDCNSKLFHKMANERRNKNFIKFLENERGLVLDNSESITDEILLYFKKLYSSPLRESWRVEDRDKASGPDGFTIAVFQDCWDVIKDDLVRVFAKFHNSGIINQNTNASFIVLLPKKSQSKKISDFRPISLITCLYKVIAKVLSRRLRGVLHETIHSTQGAFVQGRQILDAVLIANESVEEKKRSGKERVVFKIDFEKAYDHVKYDFLDHVLEKKGFSSKWRIWMRGCLSAVSYAILVNGIVKGWVKASRGLRQGDPLSPFLFTIIADVLSRMLLKAEERSLLEDFRNHLSRLALLLECKVSDWPILYPGLPLGGNPTACGFWDPVIEKISRTLDRWQKAYLSFSGRITLVHSCLSHIPNYFLSLFKIPASMATKVERMQRDFLWSGVGEGKWLWRFPRESTALWHQVIFSIYETHSNGSDVNTLVRWSHHCPWKVITQVFQDFSKYTQFVIGDEERIRFWEDLWWGTKSSKTNIQDYLE
ncbi:Transposon TX1 uncharacterized 149 kDa protein [Vitis vinifera]|uniref:Transposon TX1 uncharacterized 149 kDa protein n=1 Tax=Vitis vinifera TaxID=29760 RepID=A0A438K1S7_VITVI|nr:Transposon TX1 uncharacterized 149 kDa protein [Vitis vinifera]